MGVTTVCWLSRQLLVACVYMLLLPRVVSLLLRLLLLLRVCHLLLTQERTSQLDSLLQTKQERRVRFRALRHDAREQAELVWPAQQECS